MEKRKNTIIIMGVIIILLIGVIIYFIINNNKEYNVLEINNDKEINDTNDNNSTDNDIVQTGSENDINNVESTNNSSNNCENNNGNNYIVTDDEGDDIDNNNEIYDDFSESDLIDYFENNENEIKKSSSFKEKFKEYFVDIVDFIFYDKEIKGYTFKNISNNTKLKIISIALKIDNYIEEKMPGYKESISDTSGKIYTNVKEKLTELFLDISSGVCKNNKEECSRAKILFGDVKDTCKIGWDFIRRLISSGGSKLKDWYEVYRG